MEFQRLSRNARKCMYISSILGAVIITCILWILNEKVLYQYFGTVGTYLACGLCVILWIHTLISPYFRHKNYRFGYSKDAIEIKAGYLFMKHTVVPIERIHKIEVERGPIKRIFSLTEVTITSGGGDVLIENVDEAPAEAMTMFIMKRINHIVAEQRGQNEENI